MVTFAQLTNSFVTNSTEVRLEHRIHWAVGGAVLALVIASLFLLWRGRQSKESVHRAVVILAAGNAVTGLLWTANNYAVYSGAELTGGGIATQHMIMSYLLLFGGILGTVGFIKRKRWLAAFAPLAGLVSALMLHLHPQHARGEDVGEMVRLHSLMALILGLIALVLAGLVWQQRRALLYLLMALATLNATLLITYRHPLYADSNCAQPGPEIELDLATPQPVVAQLCQVLVIRNNDRVRYLARGAHAQHEGAKTPVGTVLRQDESSREVLKESGRYVLHDHYDPNASFYLTILPEL